MTLKDSMRSDMTSVFLNTDEFSELITYKPRGGGSRQIKAIIDREPRAVYASTESVILSTFRIMVRNSCTLGITGDEIDTGGDVIRLKADTSDTEYRDCSIVKVTYQDLGMLEIALV